MNTMIGLIVLAGLISVQWLGSKNNRSGARYLAVATSGTYGDGKYIQLLNAGK